LRESLGLDADPDVTYLRFGCKERIARERVGGQQAGWGA
jgi:L-rhamnose isomerase / sugar isomerase